MRPAVAVIQRTAGEAKALRRYAVADLGVHHSPELFHSQHEVAKATSLALAGAVHRAEAHVVAAGDWEAERAAQQAFEARVRRPHGAAPTPVGAEDACGATTGLLA